ncbi:hypothetical protein LPJ56_003347 [Coemansia sp. RSA 2599]|nr:hypothetical protein LPJ75_003115 [Coemansia sp. RSA 2598]KAJ1820869.1 hypothetical protein LPJ56_003347 [Coemansia sp. RSA 2599]
MQSSGAKRPSSYFPQYDRRQSQQMQKKPVYTPPAIVRKDSGEIVRPCLRKRSATTTDVAGLYHQHQQASAEYALSSSGAANGTAMRTPRFVHFGADLECVRWFLKGQSPRSACEDAVPDYCSISDDDSSYAVARSNRQQQQQQRQPTTVRLTAIRRPTPAFSIYEQSPVVLERVELADNKRSSAALRGTVKVHNLAFEKSVTVRYSFDQWRTVNEASASYNRTLLECQGGRPGIDRFVFTLALPASVTVCLPSTIAMCVHYSVNNNDYWDNNGGANYMFKLALPAAPAIADDDADMDAVQTQTTRSRQSSLSDGSSELYAPRRLTFGRSSQREVGQISGSPRSGISAASDSSSPQLASPPPPVFTAPTPADTRRYMAQSAALFGGSSSASAAEALSARAADVYAADSSSDSDSENNGSSDSLATQAADDCPSPSAYMQHTLCTLQPELPLYQDVAWRGGDLASSFISSPPAAGASAVAASTMYAPFAYAPTTYYGGSGNNRMYSASYSAVSPPPSEYLSLRSASSTFSAMSAPPATASSSSSSSSLAAGSSNSNGSGGAAGVPFSASRTGSPLATPMRTTSPIRHSVFDSDGAVRTGSPLAWSRNTTASALLC